MKKGILRASVLSILLGGVLQASDVLAFSLSPSGTISGAPGTTVGWGFTATWTPFDDPTYWANITQVNLINQTNALGVQGGVFLDFLSPQGGPSDAAFAPLSPNNTWTEAFDVVLQQGVGAYPILTTLAGVTVGASDSGQIQIVYDVYDGDPATGGNKKNVDPLIITVPYEVDVVAPTGTPEPSGLLLTAFGLLALPLRRRISSRP